MADRLTVKVDGLRELGERMRKLSADVSKKAAFSSVLAGANVIKKGAIQRAPDSEEPHKLTVDGQTVTVIPGNLRRNIINKRVPKNQTNLTAEYLVTVRGKAKAGFASRYGRLVEFGTVKMAAQPFLRPAFDTGKEKAVSEIAKKLERVITKAGG
jgi:HK97 gp10 family phage protein